MPSVVDLSSSRSPKKSPSKPKPPAGPKPAIIIGVSVALVLSLTFVVWFFVSQGANSTKNIAPYDPPVRNLSGVNGGGSGPSSAPPTTSVPRGLPGGE